jgi:hypothetical protein
MNKLYMFTPDPVKHVSRIFHIDLAHEVRVEADIWHVLWAFLILRIFFRYLCCFTTCLEADDTSTEIMLQD